MKKKISDIYAIYQRLVNTKMTGMDSDKAWSLIMFLTEAKKVCASYDAFREQTISHLKPEGWDEKLPLIEKFEKGEDVEDKEGLLAYRDAFLNKANEILAKEWSKEVEVEADIDLDTIKAYVKANEFTMAEAISLIEFFNV